MEKNKSVASFLERVSPVYNNVRTLAMRNLDFLGFKGVSLKSLVSCNTWVLS
jgi:hypothetical protein